MIFQYDSWDLVIVFHILYLNVIYLWLFMHRRGTLWPCQSQMPIHWAQWTQRRTQGSEARRGSRAGGSAMAHFVRRSLPFVLLKEWWCSMAVKIQGISIIFQTLMMNLSLAYDVKVWKAATMLLFLHSEANGAVFWGKSGKIHRLCPLSQPHANRSDPIRVWISLDTVASGQGLEHWHSAKALLRICWSIYILLHNTTVFWSGKSWMPRMCGTVSGSMSVTFHFSEGSVPLGDQTPTKLTHVAPWLRIHPWAQNHATDMMHLGILRMID